MQRPFLEASLSEVGCLATRGKTLEMKPEARASPGRPWEGAVKPERERTGQSSRRQGPSEALRPPGVKGAHAKWAISG